MEFEPNMGGFVLTDGDTNQYVRKLSDTEYEVIDNGFVHSINLKDYTEEDLENEVSSYYNSLAELREESGEFSDRNIVEIIAENLVYDAWVFEGEKRFLVLWDKNMYGSEATPQVVGLEFFNDDKGFDIEDHDLEFFEELNTMEINSTIDYSQIAKELEITRLR